MSFTLQRCIWDIPPDSLTHLDFRILSYFAAKADDSTFLAYPSVKTVAQKCNCSVRTVQRTLSRLLGRADNVIFTVNRKGGRGAVQYEMRFPGMEPKIEARRKRIVSFEQRRRQRGPSTKRLAKELERTNGRLDVLYDGMEAQG